MKLLRIWLLVLLAVLLPVRGTMAAAMLCLPASGSAPSQMQPMDHEGGHHGHASQEAAQHGHGGHHGQAKFTQDDCDLCAAFCSATPLPSTMPHVAQPLDLAAAAFPDFSAPAPNFQSGGQERPPRSI